MSDRPDDRKLYEELYAAESFNEAIFVLAELYDIPVTNNEERWQDGHFVREIGDLVDDIHYLVKKHSRDFK